MAKKLKPLKFDEEVKKYEAVSEQKEVKFDRCDHKDATVDRDRIVCSCGAVWTGSRLNELFDLLTKRK